MPSATRSLPGALQLAAIPAENPDMRKIRIALCLACLFGVASLSAQTGMSAGEGVSAAKTTTVAGKAVATDVSTQKPAASAEVSGTYRTLSLGMDIEAAKEQLLADPIYGYRGERDVSLLPGENRSLIETSGSSFIRRAWLQFNDGKLYVMTFQLDPDKVDYYSIYSSLVRKYGEPTALDPQKAAWSAKDIALSLERPLTVKYLDMKTFTALVGASQAGQSAADIAREDFINDF
jgi:hypothetical protein